jgi:hypothetical protein
MPFPVLEIHMTNIATREPWRDIDHLVGGQGDHPGSAGAPTTAGLDALIGLVKEIKEEAKARRGARRRARARAASSADAAAGHDEDQETVRRSAFARYAGVMELLRAAGRL